MALRGDLKKPLIHMLPDKPGTHKLGAATGQTRWYAVWGFAPWCHPVRTIFFLEGSTDQESEHAFRNLKTLEKKKESKQEALSSRDAPQKVCYKMIVHLLPQGMALAAMKNQEIL